MDALCLLEEQHRDIAAHLDAVRDEARPGCRTFLVARLARLVDAHTRAEEAHLLLAAASRLTAAEDKARLFALFETQALARHAAGRLVRTRATDVRFVARLEAFAALFAKHVDEHDRWLFPKLKRMMTDEALDALGVQMQRTFGFHAEVEPPPPSRPLPASVRRAVAQRARRAGAPPRRTPPRRPVA